MSKLNEIFVESINKAVTSADVMTDINQKPMAYASIAHAIAVYLKGDNSISAPVQMDNQVVAEESSLAEDMAKLQADNEKVSNAIDEAIKEVETPKVEETTPVVEQSAPADTWTLPIDENGIPYLNQEDFSIPERVLAYENAMTPEIQAKKRELEIAAGQQVLNETETVVTETAPAQTETPVAQSTQEAPVEFNQDHLAQLEGYKTTFDYANNPQQLDNLYHNFTAGVHSSLNDITPETLEAFLLFLQEELSKAYTRLDEWKASWLGEQNLLNQLLCQAYGVADATVETYVHDGNIFWFLEYIELYNANAWFNSYKEQMNVADLNVYVQQYLEDGSATIDNINDTNVVGLVYFMQQSTQATA